MSLFAAPQVTINLATGLPALGALNNADNLAIDHEGNIYIVEDRPGGVDDDIWIAVDLNKDGDLDDPGEGIARWVSNGAAGSEFTGLYFDLRNPNRAYVNIQHPQAASIARSRSLRSRISNRVNRVRSLGYPALDRPGSLATVDFLHSPRHFRHLSRKNSPRDSCHVRSQRGSAALLGEAAGIDVAR